MEAAGVYIAPNLTSAVAFATGAAFPSTAKQSLTQTNAARINSGQASLFGTISPLPITTASAATAYIYGTITLDKD